TGEDLLRKEGARTSRDEQEPRAGCEGGNVPRRSLLSLGRGAADTCTSAGTHGGYPAAGDDISQGVLRPILPAREVLLARRPAGPARIRMGRAISASGRGSCTTSCVGSGSSRSLSASDRRLSVCLAGQAAGRRVPGAAILAVPRAHFPAESNLLAN